MFKILKKPKKVFRCIAIYRILVLAMFLFVKHVNALTAAVVIYVGTVSRFTHAQTHHWKHDWNKCCDHELINDENRNATIEKSKKTKGCAKNYLNDA